jgi:hypothetical protein
MVMPTATFNIRIRQPLFDATGPDGQRFIFAVLEDDRCAITRDGEVIEVCDADPDSIDRAVATFLHSIRAEPRFEQNSN